MFKEESVGIDVAKDQVFNAIYFGDNVFKVMPTLVTRERDVRGA